MDSNNNRPMVVHFLQISLIFRLCLKICHFISIEFLSILCSSMLSTTPTVLLPSASLTFTHLQLMYLFSFLPHLHQLSHHLCPLINHYCFLPRILFPSYSIFFFQQSTSNYSRTASYGLQRRLVAGKGFTIPPHQTN